MAITIMLLFLLFIAPANLLVLLFALSLNFVGLLVIAYVVSQIWSTGPLSWYMLQLHENPLGFACTTLCLCVAIATIAFMVYANLPQRETQS